MAQQAENMDVTVNPTEETRVGRVIPGFEDFTPPQRVLADVLVGAFTAKYIRSKKYLEERVQFPLGYSCPPGTEAWSPQLYPKLHERLINMFKQNTPKDMLDIENMVCPILNDYLIYNISNGTVCFRKEVDRKGSKYFEMCSKSPEAFIAANKDEFNFVYKFPRDKSEKCYNLLKIWSESSLKSKFNGFMFHPYHNLDDEPFKHLYNGLPMDVLNSFMGLRFPIHESINAWRTEKYGRNLVARWLLHHIIVICEGRKDRALYTLTWMAKKLREPYWKPNTCLVIHGREGAGKTSHINTYGSLFGEHYIHYTNLQKNLIGFSHPGAETAVLALVDEVVPSQNEQAEAITRMLITEDYFNFEKKFENQRKTRNFQGVIMISNNAYCMRISEQARRYVTLRCSRTTHSKEPVMQAYHKDVLEINSGYENWSGLKALQGFFFDPDIWNNREKRNKTTNSYLEFGDGSKLPQSIDVSLGQQRSFSQDNVTNFWYKCLDRSYVVLPECNPIHPCNLDACRNINREPIGKAILDLIKSVDATGYVEGVDFTRLNDGWGTPYHSIDHLWANLLLQDTVYEEYLSDCYKNKVQGTGQAVSITKFWIRTLEIFPELGPTWQLFQQSNIKIAIPGEAFATVKLRQTQHYNGDRFPIREEIIEQKRTQIPRTVVNQQYSLVLFAPLNTMRAMFIKGTGRPDISFPDDITHGLYAMNTRNNMFREPAVENCYISLAECLSDFGFDPTEELPTWGLYGGIYNSSELTSLLSPGEGHNADAYIKIFSEIAGNTQKSLGEQRKLSSNAQKIFTSLPQIKRDLQRRIDQEKRQSPGKSIQALSELRLSATSSSSSSSSSSSTTPPSYEYL